MITSIANAVVWLAFALVAYRVLMTYVATLPTSAQLREEQERTKIALTNLGNKTKHDLEAMQLEIEKVKQRQTQQAAAASIPNVGRMFGGK